MKAYSLQLSINPQDINYALAEYDSFEVREVMIGDKPKGEYHIKIKDGSSPQAAVLYLKGKFPDCIVDLVDESGILNLEYPIYILTKSELVKSSIKEAFEAIDDELRKHSRKGIDI